jgi:hypothetical protein
MTIEQRLQAIQALTKATTQLSSGGFGRNQAYEAIQEIQNALEALKIEELKVEDSAYSLAKKLMK